MVEGIIMMVIEGYAEAYGFLRRRFGWPIAALGALVVPALVMLVLVVVVVVLFQLT